MKLSAQIVVVALLAALFIAPTGAEEKRKGRQGKKKDRDQIGLFSWAAHRLGSGNSS